MVLLGLWNDPNSYMGKTAGSRYINLYCYMYTIIKIVAHAVVGRNISFLSG